ncbi:MAG: 4-hydroxy-tetrahydrodipicolinate synthase [Chitinivibrionales bacterium]|nr:4-hydroxy-tetrahydrodipicolinate synthase [Chitinivibrionales bacterium]
MTFTGCFVALVTPFTDDGKLNEAGLRSNIDYLIDQGVAGIVPCGTTGESATLSWEEHNRVVDIAVEQAAGRVLVIAGAGSNNTSESIAAAAHAKEKGADAILCITPYYNKPTQEGLFQHYKAIATEVDIPIVVYNVPGRTGVNLSADTLHRLTQFNSIAAVKEASGDLEQVSEIHRLCADRIAILSGEDALTLPMLSLGARGSISVVGNVVPDKLSAMIRQYREGNCDRALAIHEELLPICRAMFIETNPIPVKTTMNYLGLHAGPLRLPLVAMSDDNKRKLLDVLSQAGLKPSS